MMGEPTISFSRTDFETIDFNPVGFLASRKHLPLDQLKYDLASLLKSLRNEVVELINEDYAQFISLSSNLLGLEVMITTLRQPLVVISTKVQGVKDSISDRIQLLESLLAQRSALRLRRSELENSLCIHESLNKIESLLSSSMDQDPEMIERVATEYNSLQFAVSKASPKSIIELKPVRMALAVSLKKSYVSEDALPQILRIFVLIDKVHDAELIFEETVLNPFIGSVVLCMASLLDSILEFVKTKCASICLCADTAFKSTPFDLFVDSVFTKLCSGLIEHVPFIFNAGNPTLFHASFTHFAGFLKKLERLAPTTLSGEKMRQSQAYLYLSKKWQIQVYLQIRSNEILATLESSLEKGLITSSSEHGIRSTAGLGIIAAITRCWDQDVYLPPLETRFLKLTLTCIERFGKWSESTLGSLDLQKLNQEGETPSFESELARILDFHHDLSTFSEMVVNLTEALILPNFSSSLEAQEVVIQTVKRLLDIIPPLLPSVTTKIVSSIVNKCTEVLSGVRNIPGQYRRTNRPHPTSCSYFVPVILSPLKKFVDSYCGSLGKLVTDEWKVRVVEAVTSDYASRINELLNSVKATEQSLKRLRKAKKTSLAEDESVSDEDKIRSQVSLDIRQFKDEISKVGLDVGVIPSWAQMDLAETQIVNDSKDGSVDALH